LKIKLLYDQTADFNSTLSNGNMIRRHRALVSHENASGASSIKGRRAQ